MDKKGRLAITTVIIFILVIATAALVLIYLLGGFSTISGSLKNLFGMQEAQLKALREEAAEKVEEHKEEVVEVRGYLVDAANLISGKNRYFEYSVVKGASGVKIGDNNKDKKTDYNVAIIKYIEHYKKCETKKGPGCLLDEAVKFRILNALREKFFTSIVETKQVPVYDLTNVQGLVSQDEFNSAITVTKYAAYNSLNDFEKAVIFGSNFISLKNKNEFDQKYYYLTDDYLLRECFDAEEDFNDVSKFVNDKLTLFEYEYKDKDSGKPILQASDYKFISTVYNDIQGICPAVFS